MPSKKSILLKSQGFTLVELLIVVAIIGVLASQGVPAYRRMIMKSRKGEAQIMLGNIATAESAFFSEYGGYGDHLARMGAIMEGAQFVYAAGVNSDDACAKKTKGFFPTSAVLPTLLSNPNYQLAMAAVNGQLGNVIGRGTQKICLPTDGQDNGTLVGAAAAYTASATGYIRGGSTAQQNNCNKEGVASCDQWTINQNRLLINANDGIN
ncbi:MAG: prepilin-type N-terminal cleavage/methylation domain-containing protein [Proteobacteria bacterium]|nr:prepilin-type N-terminal cleavage/methylation domain-containing protein [Pseudomonadota bacterium]